MINVGDNITVYVWMNDGTYARAGKFLSMSDDGIWIEGTIGERIGKKMYFRWDRVVELHA